MHSKGALLAVELTSWPEMLQALAVLARDKDSEFPTYTDYVFWPAMQAASGQEARSPAARHIAQQSGSVFLIPPGLDPHSFSNSRGNSRNGSKLPGQHGPIGLRELPAYTGRPSI